jgi:hypothetical protein
MPTACGMGWQVYNSWRDLNAENPECLHGYLMEQEIPKENCLDDPMMCAGNAVERIMRPAQRLEQPEVRFSLCSVQNPAPARARLQRMTARPCLVLPAAN